MWVSAAAVGWERRLRAMQFLSAASAALAEREKGKTKRGFTVTMKCRHERSRGAGERDADKA